MGRFNHEKTRLLDGECVCITGGFSCYLRRDLAEIIRSLGGEFTEDFTSRTTLLLRGQISQSGKLDKAKEKGVHVMSEQEFCDQFGLHVQLELDL